VWRYAGSLDVRCVRTCVCNPAAVKAAEELHARSKGYLTSVACSTALRVAKRARCARMLLMKLSCRRTAATRSTPSTSCGSLGTREDWILSQTAMYAMGRNLCTRHASSAAGPKRHSGHASWAAFRRKCSVKKQAYSPTAAASCVSLVRRSSKMAASEVLELRQGGLHQILKLLSFLQARHFGRVSRVSAFGISEKETVSSTRFHGGHPVNHFKGVCAGSACGPAGHFEAR
jgi:hypothetical protein